MADAENLLVVEDRADVRDWLSQMAAATFPGVEVVGAASLREARAFLAANTAPLRLALVDLGLPDGSGVELIRECAAQGLTAVVVTIYGDDAHILEAIAAGASGYLLKDGETAVMSACLKRIDAGEPPLSPAIANRILDHFRAQPRPKAPDDAGLTGRETEVLTLLARGMTVGETARTLGLKPQTVASYVKTIYHKLNVSNRAEATLAAASRGLI